jgi:rod shape determining protein RodA
MLKVDRRIFGNFDWVLLGIVCCLLAIALVNLYSAGYNQAEGQSVLYQKQFYWVLIGLALMAVTVSIDYRVIVEYAYIIHGIAFFLLALVLVIGTITHGSQRWLSLGAFSFQPSELVKLTMILALARFFSDRQIGETYGIRNLLVLFSIVAIPFGLIVDQPDLGTALFLVLVSCSIVLFVGVRRRIILFFAAAGLVLAPLGWMFLRDYQKERVLSFLNPERDPLGSGYHIIQSIIAIGSGGFWGKGMMKGTQSRLRFLPEQQTDFVFSVYAEEWGFAGALVLVFLFLSLILWGIKVARGSRDLSGTVLAFGITMFLFWGVFVNIGMVLGILPVVGIPLPFLSYGGSSMIVIMMGMGLLMNVSMRRFMF